MNAVVLHPLNDVTVETYSVNLVCSFEIIPQFNLLYLFGIRTLENSLINGSIADTDSVDSVFHWKSNENQLNQKKLNECKRLECASEQ